MLFIVTELVYWRSDRQIGHLLIPLTHLLQKLCAQEMIRLNQNYACLWTVEQIDNWALEYLGVLV